MAFDLFNKITLKRDFKFMVTPKLLHLLMTKTNELNDKGAIEVLEGCNNMSRSWPYYNNLVSHLSM